MVSTRGLVGLRPTPTAAARVTSPPYDVIKEGSALHRRLAAERDSLFHVILGDAPAEALQGLVSRGALVHDDTPCFYVYEQSWAGGERTGVFVAAEVTDYEKGQILRHEKTFDDKVRGRIALAEATGYTTEPIFLLTSAALGPTLTQAKEAAPLYELTSELGPGTDLDGLYNRIWRVPEESDMGVALTALLAPHPLYIADGHHRYHAALRGGLRHVLAYVTEEARILAYDRVIEPLIPWSRARASLELVPADDFTTPPKHSFRIYTREGCWTMAAQEIPDHVVGRLDCAILERELYPRLGLDHAHVVDPKRFDYFPESALAEMKAAVDRGDYEMAIALHPVSLEELMAVADAGLEDPSIVMPEKSTFFSPKILGGLILHRHETR